MDLGGAIRGIRKQKGISQIELANKAGITQAAISGIENGTRPGEQTIRDIAKALNTPVPLIYLLATQRDDFDKKQALLYDKFFHIVFDLLMEISGG